MEGKAKPLPMTANDIVAFLRTAHHTCEYCGGFPGNDLSCIHCGAPNRMLQEHRVIKPREFNQNFIDRLNHQKEAVGCR